MNVFLIAYLEQNLGDDLFVIHLCKRYPNVHFYTYCHSQYANAFKDLKNIHFLDNTSAMHYDLQVIVGGSIFMQSNNKTVLKKYLSDRYRIIRGLPTFIIGANFGPYSSLFFPFFYRLWFKNINRITFRDKYSYDMFRLPNMAWAPDILFDYPLPSKKRNNLIAISCIKKNDRSGLNNYYEDVYIEKLAYIANEYVKRGFSILLTAFNKIQEDDVAAKLIYDKMDIATKRKTDFLIYNGDVNTFLNRFLSASYIIGTRFHSIILALNAGIPVLPICYNDKTTNALECYGFSGKWFNINELCNTSFMDFDINRKKKLLDDISYIKIMSNEHFKHIDKLLKE